MCCICPAVSCNHLIASRNCSQLYSSGLRFTLFCLNAHQVYLTQFYRWIMATNCHVDPFTYMVSSIYVVDHFKPQNIPWKFELWNLEGKLTSILTLNGSKYDLYHLLTITLVHVSSLISIYFNISIIGNKEMLSVSCDMKNKKNNLIFSKVPAFPFSYFVMIIRILQATFHSSTH